MGKRRRIRRGIDRNETQWEADGAVEADVLRERDER